MRCKCLYTQTYYDEKGERCRECSKYVKIWDQGDTLRRATRPVRREA